MSRLSFTSPLDRREACDDIYHSPYIGLNLVPDGAELNSGGVTYLRDLHGASASAAETSAVVAEFPLEITYQGGGVAGCRDSFDVTLRALVAGSVYAIDIADSALGPWSSWVYLMLDNGAPAEIAANKRVITLNNDYNGLKWFRARRTNPVNPQPTLGDRIMADAARPLASVIPAPVITIAGLTDITGSGDPVTEGDSIPTLEGKTYQEMPRVPISVLEAKRMYLPDTAYYRLAKRYGGRWFDQNNFADLDGTLNHFHQPVTATGAIGSVTKWTRDGSEPLIDTVIESLDGQSANAAVHRGDFAFLIKARSFAGGCRSPLTVVAVDRGNYERHRVIINLTGKAIVGSCDLTRLIPSYGYQIRSADPGASPLWGPIYMNPIDGPFDDAHTVKVPVESGNSCKLQYGDPASFDTLERHLSDSGTGASSSSLLFERGVTTSEFVDYLGWTEHVAAAVGFAADTAVWERPAFYDHLPKCYNWFSEASDFHPICERIGSNLIFTHDRSDDVSSSDSSLNNYVGAGFAQLIPQGADDVGTYHLTRFDSIFSAVPFYDANPRDDFWANPIAGQPVPPAPDPSESRPDFLVNYEPWEEYDDTTNADAATLDLGYGFSFAWNVVSYTALEGGEDWESYVVTADFAVAGTLIDGRLNPIPQVGTQILSNGEGWAKGQAIITEVFGPFEVTFDTYWGAFSYDSVFEDWESYAVGIPDTGALKANNVTIEGVLDWSGPWALRGYALGDDDFEGLASGDLAEGIQSATGVNFTANGWEVDSQPYGGETWETLPVAALIDGDIGATDNDTVTNESTFTHFSSWRADWNVISY